MIVGFKTVRSITVQWHPSGAGFQAFGIERRFDLHPTKGWRSGRCRRQLLGSCEKRDIGRAIASGSSTTYRLNINRPIRIRGAAAIPITEKMMMRHAWYRRQKEREARAAATEAWNNV